MFRKLNAFFMMFLLIFTSVAVAQEAEEEEPFGASETIEIEVNTEENSNIGSEFLRKEKTCTCDEDTQKILVEAIKDVNRAALLKAQSEEKFIVWYTAIQSVGGKALFTVTKDAEDFVVENLDDTTRKELMKLEETQRKALIANVYNQVFKDAFDDSINSRELSIKARDAIQGLIDNNKICGDDKWQAEALIADFDIIIDLTKKSEAGFRKYRDLLGRYEIGRIEEEAANEQVRILEDELYKQLIINVGGTLIAGPFINAALKFVFILGGRVLLFAGGRVLAGKAVAQGAEVAGGLVVPATEAAANGGKAVARKVGTDGGWMLCGENFLATYAQYLRQVDAAAIRRASELKAKGFITSNNFDDLWFTLMLKATGTNRLVEVELLSTLRMVVSQQIRFIGSLPN